VVPPEDVVLPGDVAGSVVHPSGAGSGGGHRGTCRPRSGKHRGEGDTGQPARNRRRAGHPPTPHGGHHPKGRRPVARIL